MSLLHINDRDGQYIASINHQHKLASSYRPEEPWLLLFRTGRVDHFSTQKDAKTEASKTWPGCTFHRS